MQESVFKSRLEAINLLESAGMIKHGVAWYMPGQYICRHGEYSKPDYKPVKTKDGWKINVKTYFYPGSFVFGRSKYMTVDEEMCLSA